MNERINELALQAEQYADDTMNADPATYDKAGQVKVWRELMQAKFAELIVRECISKVSEWDMGIDNPVGATDNTSEVARDIVAEIKEHFGVEE